MQKQGANLTVEVIYRGVFEAMQRKGIKKFKTLYVQVDNTGANKCYTVVAALAALVELGICEKVYYEI
jgi:hypothetical protein